LSSASQRGAFRHHAAPAGSRSVAKRWRRRFAFSLTAVISIALVGTPLGAQRSTASSTDDGRSVRLRIETDRSTYRAGDTIRIRLTFTNGASTPIRFRATAPWRDALLRVIDGAGRVVTPTREPNDVSWVSGPGDELRPGQARVWTSRGNEWSPLRTWGYRMLGPGSYTIEGAPLLSTGIAPDTTLRSNRVAITIAP
jgi:hypothetical protein